MGKFIDLTGRRFGNWIVLKREPNRRGRIYWWCKCDCGEERGVYGQNFISGKSTNCGCKSEKRLAYLNRLKPGIASKNRSYGNYKNHAKRRRISFELSFESFINLTQQRCHYCGSESSNFLKVSGNGGFKYNGIDRKDNTIGYTIENCVPCCKRCNVAKADMSYDEFREWISDVYCNLKFEGILKMKKEVSQNKIMSPNPGLGATLA